jgi:hypothetical protein
VLAAVPARYSRFSLSAFHPPPNKLIDESDALLQLIRQLEKALRRAEQVRTTKCDNPAQYLLANIDVDALQICRYVNVG